MINRLISLEWNLRNFLSSVLCVFFLHVPINENYGYYLFICKTPYHAFINTTNWQILKIKILLSKLSDDGMNLRESESRTFVEICRRVHVSFIFWKLPKLYFRFVLPFTTRRFYAVYGRIFPILKQKNLRIVAMADYADSTSKDRGRRPE